ncbi:MULTISPECIES: acyl-CoA dehydrogenase family protein [Rhodococcus]|uniref:Acyl-CoA dehydrogenase family protein n=1 Tax=Rhodococcus aetherivorans TaxID=191292 RepID=A0A059MKY1_9NOCA|nr:MULTISPECIES: acyl-CoA dehydrogenase family protein [Rhodococcus]ETT27205.1 Butyryl-CoA dehydrogenase [Rhodococcus rhodochrous ATCC 21198]KDE11825.1 acyl-CoA dehydrogenase [Rhodococcus aetherivorans]MBC2589192.1 acyl-CoA dehydrogenase family protein [Rhodococcus aetherivorans]MDV6294160.1 acyl-CoA dehydrogenase family protein [Rhodococcus aetherivorans]QRI77743.1 acyl-CoA dehydrogenase family protein [Rhodococcus aetherivorans]
MTTNHPEGHIADLCARMRSFIDNQVIPAEPVLAREDDDARKALDQLRTQAKELGLWALGHPADVGGGGVQFLDFVYLNEIIGRSEFGQLAVGSVSMQDTLMLRKHGTEEQRERWIPPLVAGEFLPSVGLTEPEVAGSDPTLITTRAELDGDTWVINGHKWFTTGVKDAGYCTVFARTEPEDVPRHSRISAIIVPTDTPGFEILRSIPTMGHDPSDHYEVRLSDVRVPAENLLGERGKGFAVAQDRLGPGRIFHGMRWLGQAQRAYELMCERANTRYVHGSLLAEKGEVHRYIAESAAQIHAARLMTLDAARAMDSGDDARIRIGLVKFWCARMLHDVVDRAIQVHGALGLTADTPLERMYRQARYARIYDGPDEVHRMSTARKLLRDPGAAPWL